MVKLCRSDILDNCIEDSVRKDVKFHFPHVQPQSTSYRQNLAVQNVIRRAIGEEASQRFNVTVGRELTSSEKDAFHIYKQGGQVVHILGTTATVALSGFHHYLKHYLNCHISWDYDQLNIPSKFPDVDVYVKYPERFRLFENVCTASYSYVWWDWPRWEREIDRWALNGINLAYASTGIEAVWTRVYRDLGLSDADIDDHFAGPAFLAWNRMGNLRGWGGPLSKSWHARQVFLQRKILSRMRELAITPILPAFAGIVPVAFKRLFPNSKLTKLGSWCNFEEKYCCPLLLDPTDPLFKKVGIKFLQEVRAQFGTNHMYSADTFNENVPQVLQGWMFVNEILFWTQDRVKAFLTAVPQGKILVLDLFAEQMPAHDRLHSFYGQPYIWCMLHNFGGTIGMHGSLPQINEGVHKARNNTGSLVGLGMVPEGIDQNYVVYDFMADVFWSPNSLNISSWVELYARRRYGPDTSSHLIQAWQILQTTLYSYDGSLGALHGRYKICTRPSLQWTPETWYDSKLLFQAWGLILNDSHPRNSSNFNHDIVDITRQCLQVMFFGQFELLLSGFQTKNVTRFQAAQNNLIQLLKDSEEILGSERKFLLGAWLKSAQTSASNTLESHVFESNARNQVTLWGPRGEIVDYASKQWSGLVSSHHLPRWTLFISYLNKSLDQNITFNQKQYNKDVLNNIEKPFTYKLDTYPDTPSGNAFDIARRIYQTWIPKVSGSQ
ncbi:hypothetical protein M8J75_014504 [Diaphorina citri]|nr:hypothetical protein M8J75_014504 [Diaphorina citri]